MGVCGSKVGTSPRFKEKLPLEGVSSSEILYLATGIH